MANITPEIVYNDKFDEGVYPIHDWQREIINAMHNNFELSLNDKWFYQATIHGAIFWVDKGVKRLIAEDFKTFAAIEKLRWIEAEDGKFTIGLTHN